MILFPCGYEAGRCHSQSFCIYIVSSCLQYYWMCLFVVLKRREKGRLMVEEVKRYRAEMGGMIQDLKDKQDRMQILNEETSKLNKNINRSKWHAMFEHVFSFVSLNYRFFGLTQLTGRCIRTASWTSRVRL